MQHISSHLESVPTAIPNGRGGRISSSELRLSIERSQDFTGLDKTTNRYDLLLLVKRAGKSAGFSSKMIQLLDYYMAFTRETDWEEGARPIVYQSLSKTALDLGVSERHIQRIEQALFAAKALTWNDSGNHRRYGQRCPKSGVVLYAFGVDLTPLAYLKAELEAKLQKKALYDRTWMETKRQISWYRRQISAVLAEAEETAQQLPAANYGVLDVRIRTYMDLEAMRALLAEHTAIHGEIIAYIEEEGAKKEASMQQKQSSGDDISVAHIELTIQESSNELDCSPSAIRIREGSGEISEPAGKSQPDPTEKADRRQEDVILATGLQHISPKQAMNAASDRFRAHIPMHPRAMNWSDLVEAAFRVKTELHISQESWGQACQTLGREGAALCLLLTDQGMRRPNDPVQKPGAYFRGMVKRAKSRELHLHPSVFGILKREEG